MDVAYVADDDYGPRVIELGSEYVAGSEPPPPPSSPTGLPATGLLAPIGFRCCWRRGWLRRGEVRAGPEKPRP